MSASARRIAAGGLVARWFAHYRAALGVGDLRRLLSAQLVSSTGGWAYNVALLAFVFDRTHSLVWVGAAGLARFLPSLLFGAYGGVVAERTERIRLMVGTNLVCMAWQAGLTVVAATNGPVVLALAFAGLTAATRMANDPAVAATLPTLVSADELVAANALNGTIENVVVVAGPAIGAVLLLLSSATWVFGVNAASFLLAAAIVSRIRARSRPVDVTEAGKAGPLRQMSVGIRTIASLSAARTLVAYSVLVSFVYGADTVLFVGVSAHRLGTGAKGFGYLLAGLGIGGILMAAAVDRLARSGRLASIIIAGTAGYCLPTALLTVIHTPELAFAVQILRGASTLIVDVLAVTALQRAVPSEQLARVYGAFSACFIGAVALGTVVTPAITSGLGLNDALLIMAFAPTALGLFGWPALVAVDRESAGRAAVLAPRVGLFEQLQIFATAPRTVLERLASAAEEVFFEAGTAIIREGDPADALYVLTEGEVEVTSRGESAGPQRRVRTMSAPSYFGEIGVLEQIPRTATVTALSTCQCDRIEGSALLDALTTTPASSSLMENARSRLAVTHPSAQPSYPAPVA